MQYEGWVKCAVCAGSREQRNARGTGPGQVWRGLAHQTSLEVAGRLLCAAFCTTLLVRQPARPSRERGVACPHLNSSGSHISEFWLRIQLGQKEVHHLPCRWPGELAVPRSPLPYVLPNCAKNHHLWVPLPEVSAKTRQTHPDLLMDSCSPSRCSALCCWMEISGLVQNGLTPLTWVKGHSVAQGAPVPSLSSRSLAVWLYTAKEGHKRTHGPCWHHAQAYPGQEERGLPLPTNLLNPPGDLRAPLKPIWTIRGCSFPCQFIASTSPPGLSATSLPLPPSCLLLACTHSLSLDLHTSPQVSY